MISPFKYILISIGVLLLNACVTTYDTKTASTRTQNLKLDADHDGKELVVTFPGWASEADKLDALNSSAKVKASQKCPGVAYKLINIHSTPYGFSMNSFNLRINGISANIQCDEAVKDISTVSSPINNAVSNLSMCSGSDITKWNNCFATFSTPSDVKFVGEWKAGKFHGQGTLTSPIGWKYVGEFRDGVRHGQGTHIDKDGNKYVGSFKDGKEFGNGVQTFISGNKYVGEFRGGKRNGQGTYTFASGNKYVGEFRDDKRNGQGTFTFADGNKYVGESRDDKYNGQGILYSANGSIINQGTWGDGKLIKSGIVQQAITPNYEREKLRSEAEAAKKTLAEQEQLRFSQNQPPALPVLSTSAPSTATFTGKRVALVIGNQAYNVRPLLNPRNDADDVSRALKNAGFEVIDVRDATLSQMRNAVRQFGDRLLSRDVGLVYYAGHGIEVKGKNYFIPVNADIKRSDEIADQSLDVNLILEKMETAKKGINILIVDACRDDPFGRSFRSSSKGLATMDAPQGTIIAFATSPGKVAVDGTGRNSPYTKNLVKMMQVPNLPIEQVFKQVRRAVQEETKNQQTPWENTSLSGDFYFSVKK